MPNRKFLYAVFTLVGMIIGVGIFGIPYAASKAGVLIGLFYLVTLAGIILLVHLFYGEIILRTSSEHGLVGYAQIYLGRWGKKIAGAAVIFEFYGALLAYLIAAGQFLNIIFSRFFGNTYFSGFLNKNSDFFWTIIFFIFGSLLILYGLKIVASAEFFMTAFLLAVAAIFIFKGVFLVSFENFKSFNFSKFFLPYGVIFFSLSGGAAIPEIRQILKGSEEKLKKAIIWGTLIPVVVYVFFMLSVIGISGANTTKNAIDGLVPHLGSWVIIAGAIFGFLAVTTSYLVLGLNLKKIFHRDYKLSNILAWFLSCFIPLFAFFAGINDFIAVIGLIGAVAVGLEGIMTLLVYVRAKKNGDREPEYKLKVSRIILVAIILLFALGIIYQFIYLVK